MTDEDGEAAATPDNAVGYCRPPKSSQFRKGQSGNPRGRPKHAKSLKTLLAAALDGSVTVNENGERRKISKREAAAKQLANRIAQGDLPSLRLAVELLAETEEAEEQASSVTSNSRDRVKAKLETLAVRLRAMHGLSPEKQS